MTRRVVYQAGPWGAGVPAATVNIELRSGQETVWRGTADAFGVFPVPAGRSDLTCLVRDDTGTRPYMSSAPLPQFENQPVVVSWGPPTALKGGVNGVPCRAFPQVIARARKAIDERADFLFEVFFYGVEAREFASSLETTIAAMAKKATGKRPRVGRLEALLNLLTGKLQDEGPDAIALVQRLGIEAPSSLSRAACDAPPSTRPVQNRTMLHGMLCAEATVTAIGCVAYAMFSKYRRVRVEPAIGPDGQPGVRLTLGLDA